jgi:hypothetical protein
LVLFSGAIGGQFLIEPPTLKKTKKQKTKQVSSRASGATRSGRQWLGTSATLA